MNKESKRSAASWLLELAEGRQGEYALSILTALLCVACSLVPYFIIIRIITALVTGTAELFRCLTLCAWMAGCWVLRYEEKFQRTVTSTKALNDTAVEYIGGIEVIKAFGQSRTSYAKFVSAAKEGADCFIEWMRGSLFGQVAGMAVLPSTLLGILPVGCLLSMHGTLPAETFLAVIALSFGVMQPLITAFSYTDDIAQVRTIVAEVADVLSGEDMQGERHSGRGAHGH